MKTPFSKDAERLLRYAEEEAARCGCMQVLPGHLLLALLRARDSRGAKAAVLAGADAERMKASLEEGLMAEQAVKYEKRDEIVFSQAAEISLALAQSYAQARNLPETGTVEILVGLLRSEDPTIRRAAAANGLNEDKLLRAANAFTAAEAMLSSAIPQELRRRQGQDHPQAGQESGEISPKIPLN